MSKQFLQLSKIRFYTFIKENLEFQHVPEFLKWDIYVLVFINLINTTLVSNHWGWYMYQIFTCKYLVLEVGFLLCQKLDGDSLVVYQFYLLSALNNLKKKMLKERLLVGLTPFKMYTGFTKCRICMVLHPDFICIYHWFWYFYNKDIYVCIRYIQFET